jgi:nicotinamidase-related amidase
MSSATDSPRTALLLIDIQDAFTHPTYWGPSRSNPRFEPNITSLLSSYRSLVSSASPASTSPHMIIHVAHSSLSSESPLHRTSPTFAFQSFATPLPAERVIEKHVNSAFIGTELEEILRRHFDGKPGTLYLAGLTTDHCVSTTTRMAANLGVCDAPDGSEKGEVVLIEDATAAWQKSKDGFEAELVHQVHVESLREFASIEKTQKVLESWNGWI